MAVDSPSELGDLVEGRPRSFGYDEFRKYYPPARFVMTG